MEGVALKRALLAFKVSAREFEGLIRHTLGPESRRGRVWGLGLGFKVWG